MKPPYAFDALFTNKLSFLIKLDANSNRLSDMAICENACATSDAYKLKPYIQNLQFGSSVDNYFTIVNTGTIDKYVSKWGNRQMVYLGDKYLRPVVSKKAFLKDFPNSYSVKSLRPKIIIKGLTLLDACIDEFGNVIPGKSTLVICSENLDDLKFLLGLINSRLPLRYIKEKYSASSYNTGINFTKDMINLFPIPEITFEMRNSVISIVDRILTAKHVDPLSDTSVLDKEIDLLMYDFYGLNKEEIDIVEPLE